MDKLLRRRMMMLMAEEQGPPPIFEASDIVLTGSNYVDTGFKAFSASEINKDFKITIRCSQMSGVNNDVILGCKYEGSKNGVSYPGFYYRIWDASEVSVATSGSDKTNYNISSILGKTLYISRIGGAIYSNIEGGTPVRLTLRSTTFDQSLYIGVGMQTNGTLFRYGHGVIDYIKIEYL